jgi:uncharacterized membrane protein YidH (DUF202 family)
MITQSTRRPRYRTLACMFGVFLLLVSLGIASRVSDSLFSQARGRVAHTADSILLIVSLILFVVGLVSAVLLPLAITRDFITRKRQLGQ